jgi:CheY-like chemotaxis protein
MVSSPLKRLTERVRRTLGLKDHTVPVVLCADDDDDVRALCSAALAGVGFEIDLATNGREALEKLRNRRYSAVLLDLSMPYLHGATVLAVLRQSQPDVLGRLIIITAAPDAALVDLQGVSAILRKPFGMERLIGAVQDCCINDDTILTRGAS